MHILASKTIIEKIGLIRPAKCSLHSNNNKKKNNKILLVDYMASRVFELKTHQLKSPYKYSHCTSGIFLCPIFEFFRTILRIFRPLGLIIKCTLLELSNKTNNIIILCLLKPLCIILKYIIIMVKM